MAHPNAATPEEMRALIAARRTDDPTWFEYGEHVADPEEVTRILGPHLSERRRKEIERVLDNRTLNVAVVVDGMVDLGNVSAIMRSADAFGVQSVHAVDTSNTYKRSRRTTRGADKWIDRYRWEDPATCLESLRANGFTLALADADPEGTALVDVDVDVAGRFAWVFGNERDGVSEETRQLVDMSVRIPTGGFVESLNVSVAASIMLHETYRRRVTHLGGNGDLSKKDRDRIRAVWYLKTVRESELIVQRAL